MLSLAAVAMSANVKDVNKADNVNSATHLAMRLNSNAVAIRKVDDLKLVLRFRRVDSDGLYYAWVVVLADWSVADFYQVKAAVVGYGGSCRVHKVDEGEESILRDVSCFHLSKPARKDPERTPPRSTGGAPW